MAAPRELPTGSSWTSGRPKWMTPPEQGVKPAARWPKASRVDKGIMVVASGSERGDTETP